MQDEKINWKGLDQQQIEDLGAKALTQVFNDSHVVRETLKRFYVAKIKDTAKRMRKVFNEGKSYDPAKHTWEAAYVLYVKSENNFDRKLFIAAAEFISMESM